MNTERNLLLALVAVHSNLLSLEDVRQLWPEWRPDAEREFADLLVEHGRLSPEDKIHLHYLVESLLAKHDGNVTAGLAALYPAGEWQSFLETKPPDSLPSVTSMTLPPPPDTASPAPLPFANTLMTAPPTAEKAEAGPAAAGRFTRLRMHASGGMGRVWLARDQRLERDVALKELRPEFAGSPDVGRRFLVEARVTGRLEHPGIVPIYELVDEDGNSAYVMRFLRGRTLSEAIRAYHESKTGPTALERAALLQDFVALCNTVAYAHSRGVLHRDLKGQNILLGDFGEVIVLDWGLAKEMGQPEEANASSPPRLRENTRCPGKSWARRSTCHPSRLPARRPASISAPMSIALARYSMKSSRASLPSPTRPGSRERKPCKPCCGASARSRPRRPACWPRVCPSLSRRFACKPWRKTRPTVTRTPPSWPARCSAGWPMSRSWLIPIPGRRAWAAGPGGIAPW
jgi:hypothetical protein